MSDAAAAPAADESWPKADDLLTHGELSQALSERGLPRRSRCPRWGPIPSTSSDIPPPPMKAPPCLRPDHLSASRRGHVAPALPQDEPL
jgi:hypothetical protein